MTDMHLFESLVKFTKNQRSKAHWHRGYMSHHKARE